MGRVKTNTTELMCLICETLFPISRKSNKIKEENHIKNLWCIKCKDVTKHVEKLRRVTVLEKYTSADSKELFEEEDIDWGGYSTKPLIGHQNQTEKRADNHVHKKIMLDFKTWLSN